MPVSSQSALYERLFQLNRCLDQAAEMIEQFSREGLLHSEYAGPYKRELEGMRSDLSHLLTAVLHQREQEALRGRRAKTDAGGPVEG